MAAPRTSAQFVLHDILINALRSRAAENENILFQRVFLLLFQLFQKYYFRLLSTINLKVKTTLTLFQYFRTISEQSPNGDPLQGGTQSAGAAPSL